MPCASFSSASKEKDALLQCVANYFLSRTPFLCVDTSRVGIVYQTVVHKPNEISHLTREADWISTIVWSSAWQGSLLPPASAPPRSTAQSMWHEAGNHQRWLVTAPSLFCFTSRRSQVCGVEVWIFFWDLLQMYEHLSKKFTKQG